MNDAQLESANIPETEEHSFFKRLRKQAEPSQTNRTPSKRKAKNARRLAHKNRVRNRK